MEGDVANQEDKREDQATHDSGIRNPRHGTGSAAHRMEKSGTPGSDRDTDRDSAGAGESGGRAERIRDNPQHGSRPRSAQSHRRAPTLGLVSC